MIPLVNGVHWSSAVAEALKPYGIEVYGWGGSATHPSIGLRVNPRETTGEPDWVQESRRIGDGRGMAF